METLKLQSTGGFVLLDLPEADTLVGPTRLGAKLIAGNATMYARAVTYMFASLEQHKAGATIGLKVEPGQRDEAVAAIATELETEFEAQKILTSPGLRMTNEALAPISQYDKRSTMRFDDRDGITFEAELVGVGIAKAAAHTLGGLDDKRVAIEGFNEIGIAAAREIESQGGSIVRVSTAKGTLSGSFDSKTLAEAYASHGNEFVTELGSPGKPWEMWRGDGIDCIVVNSGPSAMTGEGASSLNSTPVIPAGAASLSSKALAVLRSSGAPATPDFLVSGAGALSWWPGEDASHESLRTAASDLVEGVLNEVGDHEQGAFLGACHRAEAFMDTWVTTRPFGRPLG